LATTDTITPDDLRDHVRGTLITNQAVVPTPALKETEHDLILKTIAATNGNRSAAAKLLGMSREGLRKKMQRHGIAQ
ncbi:MAG: Fis family transcriptional regulator, partial [Deltaproteobacteria bacterium HGW-Deltaproteobacteria-10]